MIKAVLFDYGGVLSPGGKSFKSSAAQLLGVRPEEVKTAEIGNKLWSGQINSDQFFAELSRLHGKTITTEQFLNESGILDRNNQVYQLALRLRQNSIRTGMLSNMYGSSADLLRASGNYDGFDPVVLSYQENLAKPDPAFYKLAINKLALKPEEILFIDDQERFLAPARQLGMKTILAGSEEQIVQDTEQLIKQENGIEL